jgi:DNA-binding Lrp family transcriptional regulator
MSNWAELDELDRQIIDILSKDARISNRKIADDLGVNEGTIRGRLKRLQKDRLVAFTAMTNPKFDKNSNVAFVSVQAEMLRYRQIAREMRNIEHVHSIMTMLGPFNIMLICLYGDLEDFYANTVGQILQVDGVLHAEVSLAVKTVKFINGVVSVAASEQHSS